MYLDAKHCASAALIKKRKAIILLHLIMIIFISIQKIRSIVRVICVVAKPTIRVSAAPRRAMHGNYDPSYNPSAADRRANDRMNYQEQEVVGVLIYYWYDHMLRETMPEVVAAIGKAIENHDWNSFKFFYDHQLALGVELPDIIYDCDNNRHWILNEQNFKRIQENEYECG